MFRQLFLEDKNHHSVREVSQESHFKAFEEVSVAQLLRLPESGECPHLLSTWTYTQDFSISRLGLKVYEWCTISWTYNFEGTTCCKTCNLRIFKIQG